MKYFLHDSNSFQDEKITQLFINYGYEGLGLFYTILEKLSFNESPVKTDVLKHQLKVGKKLEKCWNFLEEIDLISSNNGETFNKQLLNFSEKFLIKKEKNKKRISEWRENQLDTKNVTCYKSVRNTPKDNISKDNISKELSLIESNIQKVEILSILSFDEFWNLYDKKVGDKTKLQKYWDSIKEAERHKIKEHIPMYIMSRPDKKFRKDPQTYLNNKSWNDEIILESETIKPIQELPTIKRKYL